MTEVWGLPWPVWAAIIAASSALLTITVQSILTTTKDKREASSTIAKHRIEWIERFRRESSVLISEIIIEAIKDEDETARNRRLHEAANYTILMLNPKEHSELHACITSIFNHENEQYKLDIDQVPPLREHVSRVLKKEWEVAKAEILGKSEALNRARKLFDMATMSVLGITVAIRRQTV